MWQCYMVQRAWALEPDNLGLSRCQVALDKMLNFFEPQAILNPDCCEDLVSNWMCL